MLPLLKSSRQESGVILLMVLIVVIVLAIISASILFTSLNQGTSTQAQIDEIKAEQLAKGVLWEQYYKGFNGAVTNPEEMDGKIFTPQVAPRGADQYEIKVISP